MRERQREKEKVKKEGEGKGEIHRGQRIFKQQAKKVTEERPMNNTSQINNIRAV